MVTRFGADSFRKNGQSVGLVVLLHAFTAKPASLDDLRGLLREALPDADTFTPALGIGLFSFVDPNRTVAELIAAIDEIWERRRKDRPGGYDSIILVGHSAGGLLARKIYVCACGENARAPFEPELTSAGVALTGRTFAASRAWAARVDRIILMAGMNRGWSISHHLSIVNIVSWTFGLFVGRILTGLLRRKLFILSLKRGEPFVTQLRIQWIKLKCVKQSHDRALTIQLLGSTDDVVSPEDNIDLIAGRDFLYIDVPFSGHKSIIELGGAAGEARKSVIRKVLVAPEDQLRLESVLPSDDSVVGADDKVTDVVFVIHGIRDQGHWTHKVARQIMRAAHEQQLSVRIATETSSYGYFPMLPFFMPSRRHEKVAWFMDQFSEAIARYPAARMSFVGHSNGTYLLAKALMDYDSCVFENVVFAGSVVQRGFDWQKIRERRQVNNVLNYVATFDWVVAIFPKALGVLRQRDLGSAGHDGFAFADAKEPGLTWQGLVSKLRRVLGLTASGGASQHGLEPDERPGLTTNNSVTNLRYVSGRHSAALDEHNWRSIADFVLSGKPEMPPPNILGSGQRVLFKIASAMSPVILLLLVALAPAIGWLIWQTGYAEWLKTLMVVALAWVVWKTITRL